MGLNVALLNDSFPPALDGVANAVVNYAKYINKNHGTAVPVVPKYPHVVDNYPFEVYRYSSASVGTKLPYRVGNPFNPLVLKELHEKNFDLLHVHVPFVSSVLARELSVLYKHKVPTVLTYHTKYDIDIDRFVHLLGVNKTAKAFVLNNINSADEVWTVSKGTVDNLRSIGYEGDIVIMPNGTDFEIGKASAEEIAEIDRMYQLKDEFVMLFVGRIMWYKNLEIILDSLKNLKSSGYKFKAVFVGDGPDRPSVEEYAKTLGIYDLTIFTGAVYDRKKVKAFFSRANLFLFPSTFDTSGLVVKEAAACGCPSILTKDSCAAEEAEDGVSALLAEENAESFTNAVVQVLNNEELRKKLIFGAENKLYRSWESCVAEAYNRYGIVIENFQRKNYVKKNF